MKKLIIALIISVSVNGIILYQSLTLAEARAHCEIWLHERLPGSDLAYLDCLHKYHIFLKD